jgi:hypothetical protein
MNSNMIENAFFEVWSKQKYLLIGLEMTPAAIVNLSTTLFISPDGFQALTFVYVVTT